MSTISKNKILLITVIVLLLINIAMLVFFLNKGSEKRRPHGGREAMMIEFLKNEVGFTPQQLTQYDTLSKQHREIMKESFEKMRKRKEQQLKELGAGAFSDSAIEQVATLSANLQKDLELNMLKHFTTIRKLCTPEQQSKFDSLFYKVWNRRGDNKKKEGNK